MKESAKGRFFENDKVQKVNFPAMPPSWPWAEALTWRLQQYLKSIHKNVKCNNYQGEKISNIFIVVKGEESRMIYK